MKLSEYIKALKKIQRQQAKHGNDPEVCVQRHSDLTTTIGDVEDHYPRVVQALPVSGVDWMIRAHRSMKEHEAREIKTYVELAQGN